MVGALNRPNSNLQAPTSGHLSYRPDIDGLRAIAVIAVLGYHLQVSWIPGGFVGVDIFFVISGYLIGSNIISQSSNNEFSLARFYIGRVRRIIPALVVTIICFFLLSYLVLFPQEYTNFAYSALYAALSMSNIYFLNHSGYFGALASTQPLLHTWSLAVEEQFYVIFPLCIVVMFRFAPRMLNWFIILLWIGSFGWSAYGAFANPDATFYLAPTRAWELLSGTLIANQSQSSKFSVSTRNVLAMLGLAMIAFSIFVYSFETPFPGATALLPCLGAAFVIAAGQSGVSLVGKLLSLKPAVFLGLISYSLYLWHWPIIFFQQTDSILVSGASRLTTRLIIISCSLIVATLSWHFVEKPFRNRTRMPSSTALFGGLFGLGSLVVLALMVISATGFPRRFSPLAVAYASYLDYGQAHFREGKCFIVTPHTFSNFDREACLAHEDGRKNYLLLGDSHAAQLWYGLSRLLPGVHVLQATAAGCVPEFSHAYRVADSCTLLMNYILTNYLVDNHVDQLLIAARWSERDIPGLKKILAWANQRGIPVTVFGPMTEYDLALPRVLAYAAEEQDWRITDSHLMKSNARLDESLQAIAERFGARYISFYKLLCSADRCSKTASGGVPLEFDTDHLTKEGSLFVVQRLVASKQLP